MSEYILQWLHSYFHSIVNICLCNIMFVIRDDYATLLKCANLPQGAITTTIWTIMVKPVQTSRCVLGLSTSQLPSRAKRILISKVVYSFCSEKGQLQRYFLILPAENSIKVFPHLVLTFEDTLLIVLCFVYSQEVPYYIWAD